MTVQITPYVDVNKRCLELDCNQPTGLALLPRNFDTAQSKEHLVHESSVSRIRNLWREAGITETPVEKPGDNIWCISEKDIDWVAPIIFISASFLSQNPHLVSISLNVISNYLTDLFKGSSISRKASVSIVVEKEAEYIRIEYNGGPEGIGALARVVHELGLSPSSQKR